MIFFIIIKHTRYVYIVYSLSIPKFFLHLLTWTSPFSSPDFIPLASSFISCSVACLLLKPYILGIAYLLCSFRFNVRNSIQLLSAIIVKTLFNFPNHSHCICDINIICFNIYIISRTTHCFFCTCECKILYRFWEKVDFTPRIINRYDFT